MMIHIGGLGLCLPYETKSLYYGSIHGVSWEWFVICKALERFQSGRRERRKGKV